MPADLFIYPDQPGASQTPYWGSATLWSLNQQDTTHSAPRRQCALPVPAMALTERDREVLRGLHRLRVLTLAHIRNLFYPSYRVACRRVRLMVLHGYIARLWRPLQPGGSAGGPAYRLAAEGARALADEQGMGLSQLHYWGQGDDRRGHKTERSPVYLEHALELASLRIAIERGTVEVGGRVSLWRDEVEYHRQHLADTVRVALRPDARASHIKLIPDGYFVLETQAGDRGHFFVEVDRGTESIRQKWQTKVLGYKALFSSGVFHERYGVRERGTAFRVLVTTPSPARALHIHAAAERYGDPTLSQLFLVAPLPVVTVTDAVSAPIWHRGGTQSLQGLL